MNWFDGHHLESFDKNKSHQKHKMEILFVAEKRKTNSFGNSRITSWMKNTSNNFFVFPLFTEWF